MTPSGTVQYKLNYQHVPDMGTVDAFGPSANIVSINILHIAPGLFFNWLIA